ncbi:MAG: FMN-binding glutamate synthase family protein [Methylotenera sp.]|nr:FMN-binding glutamate synthase family protein [Oligoflexia bacterium]
MRKLFLIVSFGLTSGLLALSVWHHRVLWAFVIVGPILFAGFQDYFQKGKAIRRNFPVLGRFRYWFETIRPEINQYFVESNSDGVPFSREQRSLVYQRAKKEIDTLPFGTQQDVYAVGYEWINHSLAPTHIDPSQLRISIGGPDCRQPYSASIFNISAMSYGALSKNAILALNGGAKDGGFAHNTGEGGLSPYHLENGGDLIWQIGTGYFSCRNRDGSFNAELFQENAADARIKMIEIKLSQGAKPSHGGILPAKKVTLEISKIRGVPMGFDVLSPPAHSEFSTPIGLLEFVQKLRTLSGGKPVGFKLCLGKRREFIAICKAMIKTGITPDFISVDGGEGGTGAAPLEFSNHVGTPGIDGLVFVHNALTGFGLRDRIKILNSGKVTSGFGVIQRLALGADALYSARGMMLALGCIQALRCNTNHCPTGVATQDPGLVAGLVVRDKRARIANFHHETVSSVSHMIEAMGLASPAALRPWHIQKRVGPYETKNYGEIFQFLKEGELLLATIPEAFRKAFDGAIAESFQHPSDLVQPVAQLEKAENAETLKRKVVAASAA